MLWWGAVPSNALFKLPVVLTVCSVNRQSKLVEPRCSVPVTALRTNLAVHDLEEAAPAQCETAAGRGVAGEFANHFCFAYSPVECDQVKVWREIQGGSETLDKRDGAALCARNAAFTGLPLQPSEYGTDKDGQP